MLPLVENQLFEIIYIMVHCNGNFPVKIVLIMIFMAGSSVRSTLHLVPGRELCYHKFGLLRLLSTIMRGLKMLCYNEGIYITRRDFRSFKKI